MSKKVNLGCGGACYSDYINIDFVAGDGVDIVHDLTEPLPFKTGEIDEFYSHHVLEHLNYYDVRSLLKECYRCLKPGGLFKFIIPDFERAATRWLANKEDIDSMNMLMVTMLGGQAVGWSPKEGHTHSWGYSLSSIRQLLTETGLNISKLKTIDGSPPIIEGIAQK